ncbi:hypothetical protein A4G18_09175 [Pasteurellaceae bacterium Pebbles2]|nr:hypothetical protein [Pasteurellaceae bacterium Pebbles2]
MKKTLVALTVAAAAATAVSTANAAVVYEQDGAKVELSGSFRAFLGRVANDQRGDLINDGSRVEIKASQDLGNGLGAFLGYRVDLASSDFDTSLKTKRLYAGFQHADVGALSFGRQTTGADDVVQDNGYYNSGELNPLTTGADKSIKFRSKEFNGLSFGLDYLFGDASKDRKAGREDTLKNGYAASVFYNYALDDLQALDFAAVYSQDNYDIDATRTATKNKQWAVHAGYTYGPANVNFTYGQRKDERDVPNTNPAKELTPHKGRYTILQASYQVTEPSRVYAQWERDQVKDIDSGETGEIINKYLVGVDYKLHKNVVTYVQYAHKRTKTANEGAEPTYTKDNEYGVGLRVFF